MMSAVINIYCYTDVSACVNNAKMSIEKLFVALLSSSLLGGAIGAFITGRFSLGVKNREYENEYYKLVLVKRIAAYESVQKLVTGLKTAVLDEDRQPPTTSSYPMKIDCLQHTCCSLRFLLRPCGSATICFFKHET